MGSDHSSGADVTTDLERRNPETRAEPPSMPPISSCFGWGLPCGRRYRQPGELLPHPFTLTPRPEGDGAVCFLWHFPRGRPHQALPGILSCEARTFLPCARRTSDHSNRSNRDNLRPPTCGRKQGYIAEVAQHLNSAQQSRMSAGFSQRAIRPPGQGVSVPQARAQPARPSAASSDSAFRGMSTRHSLGTNPGRTLPEGLTLSRGERPRASIIRP